MFPRGREMDGRRVALEYQREPGSTRDGVTLSVPLVALNQVDAAQCDWLVPGLLREKITRLAKSLPQKLRQAFGALPEFVAPFPYPNQTPAPPPPPPTPPYPRPHPHSPIPP